MVYLKCKRLSDTKVRSFNNTGLSNPVRKEAAARILFMRPLNINKLVIKIACFAISLLFWENAWAAFQISATPYEGGYDLRFGQIRAEEAEVEKEVTIRVTSNLNKQYRVFQEFVMPMTGAEGQAVPNNNVTFYTLQGSNNAGALTTPQQQTMRSGRVLLYTSSGSGQSDSFILVYGLSMPEGLAGGNYRGRIRFTLEAVDRSTAEQQVYLNTTATLESSASLELITTGGGRIIELKAADSLQEKNEIAFKITGNLGQAYRLIQSLPEPLRSEEGELPRGSVLFKVSEGRKGIVAGEGELGCANTVLYTSSVRGEADTVLVNYHLAEPVEIKAGSYRSRVRFFLESAAPLKGIKEPSLDFLVKIEPTFELKVTPETGGRIEFKGLKPNQPPKVNEVFLEVQTNWGRPYQVSQKMENLLTNKEGKTITKENFVFHEEMVSQGGVLKQSSKIPAEVGDTALFISDEKGSPAQFKVIYELTVPRDLTAGNYSSRITYSISEL